MVKSLQPTTETDMKDSTFDALGRDLPPTTRLVLIWILARQGRKDCVETSAREVSTFLGTQPNTIFKALRELEAAGLIHREKWLGDDGGHRGIRVGVIRERAA